MKKKLFLSFFSVLAMMIVFFVMPAQAKGKLVTLGAGTYKVGEDIKPGRYVITASSGSGNVTDSNDLNIILGKARMMRRDKLIHIQHIYLKGIR